MTNTTELEVAIKRSGMTKRELAKKLGLSEMGLYKKIHNISEFKASEIALLIDFLKISNVGEIFFDNDVELKST